VVLKANERNDRHLFIGGLLAFLGGPVNNWVLGSSNIFFLSLIQQRHSFCSATLEHQSMNWHRIHSQASQHRYLW
jgi:hypothetical protein